MRIITCLLALCLCGVATATELSEKTMRHLLVASQAEEQFQASVSHMISPIMDLVRMQSRALAEQQGFTPEQQEQLDTVLQKYLTEVVQSVAGRADELVKVDELVPLYLPTMRKVLSEEDALEVIRFHESPVGKKMLAAIPDLMANVVPLVQQSVQLRAQGIFEDEFARVRGPLEQDMVRILKGP